MRSAMQLQRIVFLCPAFNLSRRCICSVVDFLGVSAPASFVLGVLGTALGFKTAMPICNANLQSGYWNKAIVAAERPLVP